MGQRHGDPLGQRPQGISNSLIDLGIEIDCLVHGEVTVTGISHDSSNIQPGDIFVAVPGMQKHGIDYLAQAIDRGAVAVASDERGVEIAAALQIPTITLKNVRSDMAALASAVYDHPERLLQLVGVTGTNGKTTTTHIMRSLLMGSGRSVGLIGTLGSFVNDHSIPSLRTTPESTDLYGLLAVMVQQGVDTVVMEVSSHALVLERVSGLLFDVAIFTNLTQDHLDFHGDMESYFAAKASLFTQSRCRHAVVCVDDAWGRTLANSISVPLETFSIQGHVADWSTGAIHTTQTTSHFTLTSNSVDVSTTSEKSLDCEINMIGNYNVANAVAAYLGCLQLGCPPTVVREQLVSLPPVPGRLQTVKIAPDVVAVVDYAHTPDAVEKVLRELRSQLQGRIITVLGCGGDRDPLKRPVMGNVAASLSDTLIVTDDNPRSENPAAIRAQILAGIEADVSVESGHVMEIGDRTLAIRKAIRLATPGDVIAVLGKGHEQGQEIDGVVHPFHDVTVILQEASNA